VASLSQGRTAAAQCGLFTHKSVPVIFEPPCILNDYFNNYNFSKAQIIRSLMMVIEPKHIGAFFNVSPCILQFNN